MKQPLRLGFHACASIAALAFALPLAPPAGATTMQVGGAIGGNDCAGEFGKSFGECRIPKAIDPHESPIIIKFDFDDDIKVEINSKLFPSIDGSEFAMELARSNEGAIGAWNYEPGPGDPGITFWVAKGGPNFNLFTDTSGDPVTSGTWFTPLNGGGNPAGLSHISFYDTGGGEVPEPGSLLLVGAALAALGMMRRRRP